MSNQKLKLARARCKVSANTLFRFANDPVKHISLMRHGKESCLIIGTNSGSFVDVNVENVQELCDYDLLSQKIDGNKYYHLTLVVIATPVTNNKD